MANEYQDQGYTAPTYTGAPGPIPPPPLPPAPGAPNPMLAGLLGFIPGVGAMYNGQFPKGLVHIGIFAIFVTLSSDFNGVFGLLVAGWVFYMAFEAYQTARARRDGLPLPDPFGLNNIGERFGFHSHGPAGTVDPATAPGAAYAPPASSYVPPTGYAPPADYGAPPPYAGYTSPYGAAPVPPAAYGVPPVPPMPPIRTSGVPAGAIWLIGFGVFALLGSMRPFLFLRGEAMGGLFLMGLAVFVYWRRASSMRMIYPPSAETNRWIAIRSLQGSGILFVVGLLTFLQGVRIVTWHQSWPFLLIYIGVSTIFQRSAPPVVTQGFSAATGDPVPAPAPAANTSTSILPQYDRPRDEERQP